MRRKRYSPYSLPPWLRSIRAGCAQFVIPFCCFQGIRVIIFPTTFDVLFLAILIGIAVALHLELL